MKHAINTCCIACLAFFVGTTYAANHALVISTEGLEFVNLDTRTVESTIQVLKAGRISGRALAIGRDTDKAYVGSSNQPLLYEVCPWSADHLAHD